MYIYTSTRRSETLIKGRANEGSAGKPSLFVCLSVYLFPGGSPATRTGDQAWPSNGPAVVASYPPKI